ncbi:MAG TPA: serine/threonine-protein kinase [Gemmatimonadales bacterium]|jgi:serine/threonine-protein kinase|nr:serine/threonine-protein kinase [Gemmatimonadales bacterium]
MAVKSHISLQPMSKADIERVRTKERSHPGLPPELLQDIARRLQFVCGMMVVYGFVSLVANYGAATHKASFLGGIAARIGLSVAVYLMVRLARLSPDRLISLGLAYEVFVALSIALTSVPSTWMTGTRSTLLWSSAHLLVVIYPVIVPSITRRALVAAILSAATVPGAVLFYAKLGVIPTPESASFLRLLIQSAVAVAIAVGISRLLYRMGEDLNRARAMGNYHLGDKLGAGGMGEVWRATHKFLARPAAIKLVRRDDVGESEEVAATTMLQRFEREAQATAQLQSPHTVNVYDFGITQDGTFYYVMELLDGLDLASLVERDGPQPPERVVSILRQACQSLFEAHERGLIHRDIKPANIFLCRYATEVDFVKVLDFGLAKNVDTSENPEFQVTRVGMIAGTPGFIAPEAAAGMGKIDGRADLYALGCVAYWLLSGQEVFDGPTPMSVLVAHMKETPPPLTPRSPQRIPKDLEQIIMDCLEKDPAKRPRTAEVLSQRLAFLGIETTWTRERAAEWWARFIPAPAASRVSREASEAPTERVIPIDPSRQ